jgi:5'-methylthioadenosine phosphorylase
MEGPAFSTRAESLANRAAGYDVIGMTNLGEAKCAREAEIAYATAAMVTDYDCLERRPRPRHRRNGRSQISIANADTAKRLIIDVLPHVPAAPDWPEHRTLDTAILTDRKFWPAKTLRDLKPILGRFA